jgi:NAD(P)-dependent dehydrogenase (short-subunit alcohol dehydrogenase family)
MTTDKRFNDKVVLVTGAASGIGLASAKRFAQEGAKLAIADIDFEGAQRAAQDIEKMWQAAVPIQANVGEVEDNQSMVEKVLEEFGQLNVVFANAGVGGGDIVQEMHPTDWDRVLQINLRGVFLTCKYSIPALVKSGGGAIVTMASSMAGWDTSLGGAAYMASKEGVTGLTKSLALQLGGYGIRVNAICPGVIKTHLGFRPGMNKEEYEARYERFAKRIPLRRVGLPEDVAAAVAFLASDDARHISGSMLLIDGGQTLQSWSNAPDSDAFPLFRTAKEE